MENFYKKISSVLIIAFIAALLLTGCGLRANAANVTTAVQPAELIKNTVQSAESIPQSVCESANAPSASGLPGETERPYGEESPVHYEGPYRYIAEDGKGTKYPEWEAGKAVKMEYGEIKIPSVWKLDNKDGFRLLDGKNRIMMEIYPAPFYPDAGRYFSVLPNHSDLISWETLKESGGYVIYDAACESSEPAASNDDTITIRRFKFFRSDEKGNHNGVEYYKGYALMFNKAFIKGRKIDYRISNRTIEEITDSFKPAEFNW